MRSRSLENSGPTGSAHGIHRKSVHLRIAVAIANAGPIGFICTEPNGATAPGNVSPPQSIPTMGFTYDARLPLCAPATGPHRIRALIVRLKRSEASLRSFFIWDFPF